MKLLTRLFILLISVAILQGCNFKSKEQLAEETAAKEQAEADSIENAVQVEKNARREKLERETTERAEKRRLAVEEKAKKGQTYKDAKGKVVFIKAEQMPAYAGGDTEMMKYLKDNLQYPAQARDDGEEGTVFVDFVIDKTGKVTDVVASDAINNDVNPALRDESVRVVSTMPNWKPATQKGKAVDAAYSIPITFRLD